MTDLFADDDLFAPRPAPAATPPPASPPPPPLPPRRSRPTPAERWIDNTGERPRLKPNARVAVELWDGTVTGDVPINSDSKLGWDVATTRWSFLPDADPCRAFDVRRYRVL